MPTPQVNTKELRYLAQNFAFEAVFLDLVDRAVSMLKGGELFVTEHGNGALPQPGVHTRAICWIAFASHIPVGFARVTIGLRPS